MNEHTRDGERDDVSQRLDKLDDAIDQDDEIEDDEIEDDEIEDDDELDDEDSGSDEGVDDEIEEDDDLDEDEEAPDELLKPIVIKGGSVPEDETIGTLRFVANPEFPYPLNIPKPPRFWMEEQTGDLSDAVETYMRGDPLRQAQLTAIKTYLKQFIERAPLTGDANVGVLLRKLERVRTTRELENFADEAAEFGAEVF